MYKYINNNRKYEFGSFIIIEIPKHHEKPTLFDIHTALDEHSLP